MKRSLLTIPLAAATIVLGASISASAASVTFDFNLLAQQNPNGTGGATLASNALTIQNYMQSQMGLQSAPGTVSVGPGVIADKSYNGEGFVVGPTVSGAVVSATLGTTDTGGAPKAGITCTTGGCSGANLDTFLRNDAFGSTPGDQWFIQFNGWATITSVTFDYEIFPDVSGTPDFILTTNVGTIAGPGSPAGTMLGTTPVNGHSDVSGTVAFETNKQAIGTATYTFTGAGVNKLNFADWPAAIGIDNLTVNYTPNSPVPEPTSMLLLGSGLAGLYARRKKRAHTV